MLLAQLLALQPVGLAALEAAGGRGGHHPVLRRTVTLIGRALSNPVTIGSLIGLTLSITGWQLPEMIAKPVGLVGDLSVPGMLLAFGISLRLDPRPGHGQAVPHVGAIVAINGGAATRGEPVRALAVGHEWAATVGGDVIAALPTVFLLAAHYRQGVLLAR